jgi:hypothetical protein
MNRNLRLGLFLFGMLAATCAGGCQGDPSQGTVQGEVTFDGQPLKEGSIRFSPVDGQSATAGARISDGKFTAKVPVGKHKVEINAPKATGRKMRAGDEMVDELTELLPPKYNSQSTLDADVKRGTQPLRFDLTSK